MPNRMLNFPALTERSKTSLEHARRSLHNYAAPRPQSPGHPRHELQLARVEHRARSSVKRIRRTLSIGRRRSEAAWGSWICSAKIRRPVARIEITDIHRVHQVIGFRHKLKLQVLTNGKAAFQANIYRLQGVSPESIS